MSELLRVRGGVPRFAHRVTSGLPVTMVAFGTSLTLNGRYLERVVPALEARFGNPALRLELRGLRGFTAQMGSFRVASDVLPPAPNLVFLEFSHNEVTESAVEAIPEAVRGIVAQVRAALPSAEFAIVELAPPGSAAGGPTPAMTAHEAVADELALPSIDLASAVERLIAAGDASWSDGPHPLTTDGTHHAAAAGAVLGEPFAAAVVALVDASAALAPADVAVRSSPFARVDRRPAVAFAGSGGWALGVPHQHAGRNAEAYDETVATPIVAGATLHVRFAGTRLIGWLMGHATVHASMPGTGAVGSFDIDTGTNWVYFGLTPELPNGRYAIDLAFAGDIAVGDLMVQDGSFL